MKKEAVILLVIFVLILNLSIIYSFDSGNIGNLSHSIQASYAPSAHLKGWINISLENEPTDSLFELNSNSISLIDLLNINKNKGYSGFNGFTCSPLSCETAYTSSNPESSKNFNLGDEESSIFGLQITGNLEAVKSINFTIESDVLSSCYNQLSIDLFNDGTIDIINNKVKDAPNCDFTKTYGCFTTGNTYGVIDSTPYCQRINLDEAPGFKLGAWVRNESENIGELTMELYDRYGDSIKSCKINMEDINSSGGEVSCGINYSNIGSQDYYVCIYSDDTGDYRIKGNPSPSTSCGFHGYPILSETSAYQIFAEGKRFKELTGSSLDMPNEDDLGSEAYNYLETTYGLDSEGGYIDCSAGCIIPIKVTAHTAQNIIASGLSLIYDIVGFSGSEETNLYDISESTATISAGFQKIYLDEANLSVPSNFGNQTISLKLGNEEIFSETINIGEVPVIQSIKPTTTASAYPTTFEASVDSEKEIIRYEWDFGNNDTETTTTNKIIHTYDSTGTYKLKVTVTDSSQGTSTREFDIEVGSPKIIINTLLGEMVTNLNNIKNQINELSSFQQKSLQPILDIGALETELENIQAANATAETEEDYNEILGKLLELDIPQSIVTSMSANSISFYPQEENINLDILKSIGGGDYDSSQRSSYIEAIFGWNQENTDAKITFNELSAQYEEFDVPLLKIFELNINENPSREDAYIIIPELENLMFKEDYSENNQDTTTYIILTGSQKTITFSTTEDIGFSDLPVFISPAINKLATQENVETKQKVSKTTFLILIFSLLAIIGIVVYIVLQEWYKRKYEKHLFKNRNDLYNLVSYIQSSKKKGLKDNEIISRLKKTGWRSEQINYLMKKYAGKRTGMPEIPVGKILKGINKKKKEMPQGKSVRGYPQKKQFQKKSFSGFSPSQRKRFP